MTGSVTLPDGRVLAYEEYGIATGFPVLSFHGGLSSRLDAAPAHHAAVAKGVRLISPDRPGMGLSSYQPRRRLTDWPADVTSLTGALGIEEFAVMGWSAGGPYAAICAARMVGRVNGGGAPLECGAAGPLRHHPRALPGGSRPADPDQADPVAGLGADEGQHRQRQQCPGCSAPSCVRSRRRTRRFSPSGDRRTTRSAFVREAMRQGTEGCVQDYRIFGEPWGFALEEIRIPVHIWEGADDRTGPPGYRTFLKHHIPQASVTVVPGEGHLSLLPHQAPAIFASLLGGDHNAESTSRRNIG